MSLSSAYWTYCNYGCCGNTTVDGLETLPCCQKPETSQYIYMVMIAALLIPCGILVVIVQRFGKRCKNSCRNILRPSSRIDNLHGTMSGRRLMIATIFDLLHSSNERQHHCSVEVIHPPPYEDAIKQSYDELNPPKYSEIHKVDFDHHSLPCDGEPPRYEELSTGTLNDISSRSSSILLSESRFAPTSSGNEDDCTISCQNDGFLFDASLEQTNQYSVH